MKNAFEFKIDETLDEQKQNQRFKKLSLKGKKL